ncbi:hypothetical protein AJ80_09380 [Polytolypa hystricis UAMH7299]|uniref:Aminoglycoside phosphotransferase domain-containing protein n=1 Tax=Polytolypa hystricis (strain UAMH7299) TaxID=1447883 RepID=A0A2B7WRV3_POLH7|nr:hypothetical protein AJ80_09380 [Polytolypa hystricis UAMH7299]
MLNRASPFERAYRDATNYQKSLPEDDIATLEKYLKVAPYTSLHRPVLRHPDLQPNNTFVSKNGNLDIVGLIDWQHCSALPDFLAAGIPHYIQNYDDEGSLRFVQPKLPPQETLDKMSGSERSAALEQFRRRHLHFYYRGFTQMLSPSHLRALEYGSGGSHLLKRKIFTNAGNPWEGDNAQLIAGTDDTAAAAEGSSSNNDIPPPCLISFDSSETQDALRIVKEHEEIDGQLSFIRNAIGVSSEGWTSNEMFEDAVARSRAWRELAVETAKDDDDDRGMTERHWPFDDFDEDE